MRRVLSRLACPRATPALLRSVGELINPATLAEELAEVLAAVTQVAVDVVPLDRL